MAEYMPIHESEDEDELEQSSRSAGSLEGLSRDIPMEGGSGSGGGGGEGGENIDIPPSTTLGTKKPRGRPPGSKNKPKPPVVLSRETDFAAMKAMVLEVSPGCDVVENVVQFARRQHLGVSIISGCGSVSSVTLLHPATHAPTLALHGPFNILSITGSVLLGMLPMPSSPSFPSPACSFGVSLAGQQGQVFGGVVGGKVVAASKVVLVVATFMNPSIHRLPSEFEELDLHQAHGVVGGTTEGDQGCSTTASTSGMSTSGGYGIGLSAGPLSSHQSPPHMGSWTPSARPSRPY
ncbi:hypothetical protein NMG60_11033625 [Bertholletia excelsa]